MSAARFLRFALPMQVAAVCYRRRRRGAEFLLVNTNGGGKWTFPKGAPISSLSHSQSAAREAFEEAGVHGSVESHHFHIYLHSKGVFWKPPGVREFAVKAFLLEVEDLTQAQESGRNPTWFLPENARIVLAQGREVKYAKEIQETLDRAMDRLNLGKVVSAV